MGIMKRLRFPDGSRVDQTRVMGDGSRAEVYPIGGIRQRRSAAALVPTPSPTTFVRSDVDVAHIRAIAQRAALIGHNSENCDDRPPGTHAEGFLACLEWLDGNRDTVSVLLSWAGETGEPPT